MLNSWIESIRLELKMYELEGSINFILIRSDSNIWDKHENDDDEAELV